MFQKWYNVYRKNKSKKGNIMRTEELREIYETLTKETSNLNMLASIDLWRERILETGHVRSMINISEMIDKLENHLIVNGRKLSKNGEAFKLQNTINKLNLELDELKETDMFDRIIKRLCKVRKEDEPPFKLRTITQEEVDKMLDDANCIKMGDGTHLKTVDLRGYDLRGISFRGRTLSRVLFDNSCLNSVSFIRAKMIDCSFVATVMNKACMRAAEISNCSFCNAEMKNLDAIMAKIYLSSFEGANLKEAALTSSRIEYSVFDDANIECATTINAAIGECSFVGSNLFGINFSETYLNNKSIELIRKARAFDLNNLVR